jgi:integrase
MRTLNAMRNTALVLVMLGHGLGINELRDLKVRHFLHADGSVRREARLVPNSESRAPRRLLWINTRVVHRVEAYLESRTPAAEGLALAYRGLDPDAPLFPAGESAKGGPSSEWAAGGATYVTTKWLSELLCAIFQKAQVHASPSRSARLTLAHRMLSGGADEAAVAQVLGLQTRELLRRLRSVAPRRTAEEALARAIWSGMVRLSWW